jgi:hypothetical protein
MLRPGTWLIDKASCNSSMPGDMFNSPFIPVKKKNKKMKEKQEVENKNNKRSDVGYGYNLHWQKQSISTKQLTKTVEQNSSPPTFFQFHHRATHVGGQSIHSSNFLQYHLKIRMKTKSYPEKVKTYFHISLLLCTFSQTKALVKQTKKTPRFHPPKCTAHLRHSRQRTPSLASEFRLR